MPAAASPDIRERTEHLPNTAKDFFRADERLLRLNLADIPMPQVGGLHVEGFKPSWLQRLLGKR